MLQHLKKTRTWWIEVFLGAALLLAAFGFIVFGPKQLVPCNEARFPNSLLGSIFGHADGVIVLCNVPTPAAWVAASLLVALAIALDRPATTGRPHTW